MECKNCSSTLRDQDGFCSYCGSRVIGERISFKFLLKEILDKVINVDNRFLKTLFHLFTKPDKVINGYIHGVRKRYFNPFSYLLISITLSGISLYFLKDTAIESMTNINSTPNNPFSDPEFAENYMNFIFDYQAILTALAIPFYGIMSWLVFYNKKMYNFFEHCIIYIYTSAQYSIVNFFFAISVYFFEPKLSGSVTLIIFGLSFVYNSYVLIKIFKLKPLQFIIKFFYFLLILIVLYVITSIITAFAMYLMFGAEYFKKFAPPKKNDTIQKIQPIDSLNTIQKKNDSIKKDPKAISFYEASSRLNCLS
ncbi:MAG: DUF3667 domain-containing protein [Flavobacteriaceae bacterium]